MPTLTRWYIKTAFVYFVLALLVGILLGAQAIWALIPLQADLMASYFHLMAEGWITMLIIGVAFWMFPKFSLDRPRRNEGLGWASYLLLNTGLVLRVISEPANALVASPASTWAILLVAAAILQWLGGMAFVINTWSRVKVK